MRLPRWGGAGAMQWVLQDFEDTRKLGDALTRLGVAHSWHKVVPFVGELIPEPQIVDPEQVVLFGSYGLRHFASKKGLRPGVFTLRPFLFEDNWAPFLLNGRDALLMRLDQVHGRLPDGDWFMRPVDDSKAEPGRVRSAAEIRVLAEKVMAVPVDDIPKGSLRPDTDLMMTRPARIRVEWRIWVVADQVVTWSLYKEGARVVYRPEIDADAQSFAEAMVAANPGYAEAYVLDVCRTDEGMKLLETNCINAAGFYAADLQKLVAALEGLAHG